VPGAIQDSERIAAFIREHLSEIDEIYVSLDSHHVRSESLGYLTPPQKLHIAHGAFWQDSNGTSPTPFTFIKHKDVVDGVWIPRDHTHLV
jgi:nicotinamidase/pyrazinamidase